MMQTKGDEWDYVFYPTPMSDTDRFTFLTKRIAVTAGQTVTIEAQKCTSAEANFKTQGYYYDARGCGGDYFNTNKGTTVQTFEVNIEANGYITIGGRYTVQDGSYSGPSDIFRGYYIKVKVS